MESANRYIEMFFSMAGRNARYIADIPEVRRSLGLLPVYADTQQETMPARKDMTPVAVAVDERLAQVVSANPLFLGVGIGLKDGGYLGSPASLRPAGYDPRTRNWYETALSVEGEESYGEIYRAAAGDTPVCAAAAEIRDAEGAVIGASYININLDTMTNIIGAVRIGKTGRVTLVEGTGMVVASDQFRDAAFTNLADGTIPGLEDALTLAPGTYIRDVDGTSRVVTVFKGFNNWNFLCIMDESEVYEAGTALIRLLLGITLATVLLALVLGRLFAHTLSKPVRVLSSEAERISRGERTVDIQIRRSDEIGQLASAFANMVLRLNERVDFAQRMRSEAEQAAEAKTKFLAGMSHEIRTPLNSIIGMSEILMRKIATQDFYRELYEFVSIIQQSGISLLALINDILDLSKIESGSLQLHEAKYSFVSLLNDVINIENTLIFEHKDINFIVHADVDIPYELFGDETVVRKVLVNLLTNAVKYTIYGSITLNITLIERDDDGVTLAFTVKDTGIGIKEEDQQTIFSEFKRVDGKFSQKTEGTGLGLTIVRNLCRLMHGDVAVSSVYGSGSTFTATLRQRAASSKHLAAVVDPGHKRVLLFKDEEAQHASVVSALRELGLPELKTVETLRDFSEAFAGGAYDHAFISLRRVREYSLSRETPGLETCREKSPGTKLVVMTMLGQITDIPGASSITLPVYCVPLANVLNGVDGEFSPETRVRDAHGLPDFSAPTATVLVVDDVPTNLRVAKEFLDFYGIAAETCAGGAEAPAMVAGKRYDLIFMDHMMPEVDGLEAVRRIRRTGGDDYFRTVPIVALTANAVVGRKEMFLENGFNDFLSKPVEAQALDAILKKWLPPEKRLPAGTIAHNDRMDVPIVQLCLVAGLDVEKGISNIGGRKAAYAAVLSVFRRDGETLIPRLREALAAGDLAAYSAAAHALKGALRTIGAGRLADAAMRLEKTAASGDAVVPEEETQSFLDELQALIGAFDLVMPSLTAGENGNNSGTSATDDALPPVLDMLKTALDAGNIRDVDNLLAQCRDMELTADGRALIHEIELSFINFEFEEAAAKIGNAGLTIQHLQDRSGRFRNHT
jgi:signal transduction histidine kinase/CheY-like chemotaxis protein